MTVSSSSRGWLEWLTFGLLGKSQPRTKQRRSLGSSRSQARHNARRRSGNTMYELMKKGPDQRSDQRSDPRP